MTPSTKRELLCLLLCLSSSTSAGCFLIGEVESPATDIFTGDVGLSDAQIARADLSVDQGTPRDEGVDASTAQPWWDERWRGRVQFTVGALTQRYPLSVTLPLLVSKEDVEGAADDGRDFRVLDRDHREVPFQIERSPGQTWRLWIKLDSLGEGDTYWLYFDNPTALPPEGESLWGEDYLRVLHFDRQGNSHLLFDESTRAGHATLQAHDPSGPVGVATFEPAMGGTAVVLGDAHYIDIKSEEQVSAEEARDLSVERGEALTFWALVQIDPVEGDQPESYLWDAQTLCRGVRSRLSPDVELFVELFHHAEGSPFCKDAGQDMPRFTVDAIITEPHVIDHTQWHAITAIYDLITEQMTVYIDDGPARIASLPHREQMPSTFSADRALRLGCSTDCTSASGQRSRLRGRFDEFHALDGAVSADWVALQSRAARGRLMALQAAERREQ